MKTTLLGCMGIGLVCLGLALLAGCPQTNVKDNSGEKTEGVTKEGTSGENGTAETPGEATTETPGEATTETPGESKTETPGATTTETPGATEPETPGETKTETPGEATTETPGESKTETPGATETETPGQTETETPGETKTETPGESKTETPGAAETETPGETNMEPATDTTKEGAGEPMTATKKVVTSGSPETVRFAVAWSADADAAAAGKEAAEAAVAALGGPAKAVVFYVYYQQPDFVPNEADQTKAVKADTAAEQAAAKAVAAVCGDVPNLGCRARCLTNGGTLLKNAVAVLAVGGEQASVATADVPILDDRKASGKQVAEAMKDVKDLSVILALAEMRLSFETKEGVSVEDFIRGVLENSPENVTLFGGNSMPDDLAAEGLAGAQFFNGRPLKGHVVALGLGGPIKTFSDHTNEFKPSDQTVTVTKTKDKWIITLDDKPAMDVYRQTRGMTPEEVLTADWQHPIGVIVGENKQYVRMILNWIDADGKDMDGKDMGLPPGALCFVAPVVEGTKIKILGGGNDAAAIVASAKEGVGETIGEAEAAGAKPALCLVSDCCARGMRLRTFGQAGDDEVTEAIIPAMKTEFPIFGFYAWGELGRIRGEYQGLSHQYQQHTFVSSIVTVPEK